MGEAERQGAEFGWGSSKFKEQFPRLSDSAAAHFDEANRNMIWLRLHGYMAESERNRIMKRITTAIEKALIGGVLPYVE